MQATSTRHPDLTIADAVVLGILWPGDKAESYFAIPVAQVEETRTLWRPRVASFRVVRDRAYLDSQWIGIKEASGNGVAGWGRCKITGDMPRGRALYELDVAAQPTYGDGSPRKTWEQLGEVERWSWERP